MTDRLLVRYAALAHRIQVLLEDPLLSTRPGAQGLEATEEVRQLIEDAVYHLGLHESAMPGASAPPAQTLAALELAIEGALADR